jgi:hypothetical protein
MSRAEAIIAAAGLVALAALVAAGFFWVQAVLQGWLLGLVFWSSVAIGALVLILIHRLTGGIWGTAMAPVLGPASMTVPLFALLFIPVMVGLGEVYVWAGDPTVVKADVIDNYLNLSGYVLRTLVAFVAWGAILVFVVRLHAGKLFAALGLAFHGLVMSGVAVDWVLSTDPHFASTAFATEFMVQQLLAALAFVALFAPAIAPVRARLDLGELMIATLVGEFYLGLMSLIVFWYGDLPHQAHWYLVRVRYGWQWVILATVLLEAVIPFLILLEEKRRRDPRWLRIAGASVLIGVMLHIVWWLGPTYASGGVIAGGGALVAIGAAFLLGWRRIAPDRVAAEAEAGHG